MNRPDIHLEADLDPELRAFAESLGNLMVAEVEPLIIEEPRPAVAQRSQRHVRGRQLAVAASMVVVVLLAAVAVRGRDEPSPTLEPGTPASGHMWVTLDAEAGFTLSAATDETGGERSIAGTARRTTTFVSKDDPTRAPWITVDVDLEASDCCHGTDGAPLQAGPRPTKVDFGTKSGWIPDSNMPGPEDDVRSGTARSLLIPVDGNLAYVAAVGLAEDELFAALATLAVDADGFVELPSVVGRFDRITTPAELPTSTARYSPDASGGYVLVTASHDPRLWERELGGAMQSANSGDPVVRTVNGRRILVSGGPYFNTAYSFNALWRDEASSQVVSMQGLVADEAAVDRVLAAVRNVDEATWQDMVQRCPDVFSTSPATESC